MESALSLVLFLCPDDDDDFYFLFFLLLLLLSCGHFFSPPSPPLDFPTGVRWLYNLQWLFSEFHISLPSHGGILQLHEITTFVIILGVSGGEQRWQGAGQWQGLVACPALGVVPARLPLSPARGLAQSLCFHGFPVDLDKPGHMPEAGGR